MKKLLNQYEKAVINILLKIKHEFRDSYYKCVVEFIKYLNKKTLGNFVVWLWKKTKLKTKRSKAKETRNSTMIKMKVEKKTK